MEQLWAPWRLAYVASAKPSGSEPCFICAGLASNEDRANLIVERGKLAVVLLNKYPYNNGHLLVAPIAHKGHLQDLDQFEILETQYALRRMIEHLDQMMKPNGYNIGLNLGQAAGAGLPGHLHWHIVPRWHGDTNFMPVLTDVKVIAQSLSALYEALTRQLASP